MAIYNAKSSHACFQAQLCLVSQQNICSTQRHALKRSCHRSVSTRAQTIPQRPLKGWSSETTWERVLRYPGGQERLIRYPAAQLLEEEEESLASADSTERYSDWWGIERYYESSTDEDDDRSEGEALQEPSSTSGRISEDSRSMTQERPMQQGLPSSPAELLRYISSDEYRQAQADRQRLVKSSYQILEHSPWLQSQPLYLLAMKQDHGQDALTYTLRTRVQRKQAEDELSKVLGRRRADGSSLIRVEEMKDGILAFEDEADAHRYGAMLEAEGVEALAMECDGHAVFRQSNEVSAVVVLISKCSGLECHLPMPEELRPALRGQQSLEEDSSNI